MRQRDAAVAAVGVVVATLVIGAAVAAITGTLVGNCTVSDDRETVTLVDADGSTLATVSVRIADSDCERYVGLSRTDALPGGEGMLFVHPEEATQAYVMRNMSFPLDIVFVDTAGRVTTIHHAPVPAATPDDDLRRYRGRARYVLEVPRGWTNETGLSVGDCVAVPADVASGPPPTCPTDG